MARAVSPENPTTTPATHVKASLCRRSWVVGVRPLAPRQPRRNDPSPHRYPALFPSNTLALVVRPPEAPSAPEQDAGSKPPMSSLAFLGSVPAVVVLRSKRRWGGTQAQDMLARKVQKVSCVWIGRLAKVTGGCGGGWTWVPFPVPGKQNAGMTWDIVR